MAAGHRRSPRERPSRPRAGRRRCETGNVTTTGADISADTAVNGAAEYVGPGSATWLAGEWAGALMKPTTWRNLALFSAAMLAIAFVNGEVALWIIGAVAAVIVLTRSDVLVRLFGGQS